jgi:hypothetical protein
VQNLALIGGGLAGVRGSLRRSPNLAILQLPCLKLGTVSARHEPILQGKDAALYHAIESKLPIRDHGTPYCPYECNHKISGKRVCRTLQSLLDLLADLSRHLSVTLSILGGFV